MTTAKLTNPTPIAAACWQVGWFCRSDLTFGAEASEGIKTLMNWYNPVGPLMGKSSLGIIAFFLSWVILNSLWKGKETNFGRIAIVAMALVAVGLIFTFPPVWSMLLGGE
jgi:hypothetical protein